MAHNFGGGNYYQDLSLAAGTYTIALQWDDDFYSVGELTGAQNDLDIYIADQYGNELFGFNRNNIGGDPLEILPFVVKANVPAKIIITRKSGTRNVRFKYIIFRGEGVINNYVQNNGTIIGQANAEGAIAVGAVLYTNTPPYGVNPPTVASFSSRGGIKIDGVDRHKPDITAPNGVNTTVDFGAVNIDNDPFPNFFGTSAAAPHAAAVAALLNEARKKYFNGETFSGEQMRSLLQTTAIDMYSPGYDTSSGYGFIQADKALLSFCSPHPLIDSFHLQDSSFTAGTDPVTVVINGEYIAPNASVIFQYDTIPAVVNGNGTVLTASIPPFMGNPPLVIYNPPITPSGLDGGVSDSIYLSGMQPQNVRITVNNATKRYGEHIPDYSVSVTVNDVPLDQTGLTMQVSSV
ncbi:MAG: S8 family serine peptidase [Paludibaculum sp.]